MITSLVDFIVTPAYADTSAAQPQGTGLSMFIMFGVFILFMYFVIWRPQNKRAKEHRALLNSLAKGDEVVTAGGMLGKVSKISDQYVSISLADNVEITLQRSSIVSALPKGTMKSLL